jgi:hypothetical protein
LILSAELIINAKLRTIVTMRINRGGWDGKRYLYKNERWDAERYLIVRGLLVCQMMNWEGRNVGRDEEESRWWIGSVIGDALPQIGFV